MDAMRALDVELSVVVAYGHILPRVVIELPKFGTINIHASLLPALRGAAPIQAAILQGMSETGITIMQMVPALDAGPMLHTLRTNISSDETYGELHNRLSELGALGSTTPCAPRIRAPCDQLTPTASPCAAERAAFAYGRCSRPANRVSRRWSGAGAEALMSATGSYKSALAVGTAGTPLAGRLSFELCLRSKTPSAGNTFQD